METQRSCKEKCEFDRQTPCRASTTRYMAGVPGGPGMLRRGWLRLADGDCPWGSILSAPFAWGWFGTGWSSTHPASARPSGVVSACGGAGRCGERCCGSRPMSSSAMADRAERTALAISTAAYVGTGVVAFMRAGGVRARVRAMRATVMSGYPDPLSGMPDAKARAPGGHADRGRSPPPTGTDLADRVRDDLVAGVRRD